MALYDIKREMLALVDEETGEILDWDAFDRLQMTQEEKRENVLLWIKNLTADSKAIREEEKNLAERRKKLENRAESLTRYIESDLEGAKFKTARVAVSYRKSTSVNVTDLSKIPADYLRYKEPEADKTALKDAMKAGEVFEGCELIEKISMQIK